MKNSKRILAAVLAAVLLVTTACSKDTTWVAEYQDTKLPAGVYNFYMLNNYDLASTKVEDSSKDVLSQQIDGVSAEQWVKDAALKDLKRYFAVIKKFDEYGYTLTEEDTASIKEYASSQMEAYGDFLTKNGISLESLELYFTNNYKNNTMFMNLYGEGGEFEISKEDLTKHFTENYTNSQYIVVPKFDQTTGEKLEGEALEKAKTEAQGYYDRALKGDEDFEDIILDWERAMYEGEDAESHTHETKGLHDTILRKDAVDFPEKYMELVNKTAIGSTVMDEDDNYFYVILRKDVLSQENILETYTQQLMVDMKTEEYKGKVDEWAEGIELKLNQASVDFYTPKKLKLE